MTRDIGQLISNTHFLPPAFQIVPRLLLLLDNSEDGNSEDVADLIRVDPGLTADVLRVCNSAHFSGSFRAETLTEAVMRLGLSEIYRTVMSVITSPVMSSLSSGFGREETNLWNHSLAVATGAQILAQDKNIQVELAFTTGLLHDLGKVVICHALNGEYSRLLQDAEQNSKQISALEKDLFGMDHAEVGARLLNRWNFSANIVAAVRHHHNPLVSPDQKELAAVIHVANLMAFHINQGSGHVGYVPYFNSESLELLGMSREALDEQYIPQVQEKFLKELQLSLGFQAPV